MSGAPVAVLGLGLWYLFNRTPSQTAALATAERHMESGSDAYNELRAATREPGNYEHLYDPSLPESQRSKLERGAQELSIAPMAFDNNGVGPIVHVPLESSSQRAAGAIV